jgi:hypothetical protein
MRTAPRLTLVPGGLGGRRILEGLPSMKQVNPAANARATLTHGPKTLLVYTREGGPTPPWFIARIFR